MLGTKYHVYKHGVSGDQVVRTMSYSLPEELLPHIDVVAPTTYFGTLQSMKTTSFLEPETSLKSGIDSSAASLFPDCVPFVTPNCLRSMYNTTNYVPRNVNNTLGVAGYLNQFANYADLQAGQPRTFVRGS
jgi:tripeptidyl-peptidase-1